MTLVYCSIDERYVNPLFEVFDGGDFILSSYHDVEESLTEMQIFTPDPATIPQAIACLKSALEIVGVQAEPQVREIPDEDWKFAYRKHFKTEILSPRLAIVPEWEVAAFDAAHTGPNEPRKLILDPGMAFGTGQHATTHACLKYLDQLAAEDRNRSFLDVGCGSGILAIAATLEGFRNVAGFDIDPSAVENANENARKNGLDLQFFRGDLSGTSTLQDVTPLSGPQAPRSFVSDVVAANVLGPILIRFANEIARLVAPNGHVILSGILDELYPDVKAAYTQRGFTEISSKLIGEWRTGLFKNRAIGI